MNKRLNWPLRWALVLLLGVQAFSLNAAESIHFLATGDTGSGLEGQKQVAEAMANYAVKDQGSNAVNFVILLGDNFYEKGVMSPDDPQWQDKFEKMYDPVKLPMPFLAVLGNHDWRYDHPEAEIDYPRQHRGTRWQMDDHWYKREFTGPEDEPMVDFFFIDTQLWDDADANVAKAGGKKLGDQQLAWLKRALKQSRARWKFVAAHHPAYSNGAHGHDAFVLHLRELLTPLFQENGVTAFITGHDHDLERIEVPGVSTMFLISGAGSKLRPQKYEDWKPFFASTLGFAAIDVTPTEMRGEFIDVNGKTLDTWHRAANAEKVSEPAPK